MKTLHLTLKKKWFDMIASGEKLEEYRELKQYWFDRLTNLSFYEWEETSYSETIEKIKAGQVDILKKFDTITFRNGYQKNAPTMVVELLWISVGEPMRTWSDDFKGEVFVLRLGEIIKTESF